MIGMTAAGFEGAAALAAHVERAGPGSYRNEVVLRVGSRPPNVPASMCALHGETGMHLAHAARDVRMLMMGDGHSTHEVAPQTRTPLIGVA